MQNLNKRFFVLWLERKRQTCRSQCAVLKIYQVYHFLRSISVKNLQNGRYRHYLHVEFLSLNCQKYKIKIFIYGARARKTRAS